MAYVTVQRIRSRRIRTRDLSETESFDIGRASDCDFTLNDAALSQHHCIIEKQPDGTWRIKATDSKQYFKLNRIRHSDAELQDGDLIRIGKYHITFHDSELVRDGDDQDPSLADDPQPGDSETSSGPIVDEAEQERLISLEREIQQAHADELKLLRVQLAGARDDRDAERETRELAEQERNELTASVDELNAALNDQTALTTTIDEAITEERAARDQLMQELDEFRSLRDSINDNLTALADREESWKSDEAELRAELDSATQRLADTDSTLEEVRQENESLTARIDEHTAIASVRDEAIQRNAELEEQIKELTTAAGTTAELSERVTELESALRDAEAATADAEKRAVSISEELAEAERKVNEHERDDVPAAALAEANDRADAAERKQSLAQQNLDQYKDRFKQLATDRERALARIKIVQSQLQKAQADIKRTRADAKKREGILSEYIRNVSHDDASEATIVELTDDEIRRARAAGATIVEVDGA